MNFCKNHPSSAESYYYRGECTRCSAGKVADVSGVQLICYVYATGTHMDPRDFEAAVLARLIIIEDRRTSEDVEILRRLREFL